MMEEPRGRNPFSRRLAGRLKGLAYQGGAAKRARERQRVTARPVTGRYRPPIREMNIGKPILRAIMKVPIVRRTMRKIPGIRRIVPGSKQSIARAEILAGTRQVYTVRASGGSTGLMTTARGLAKTARMAVPVAAVGAGLAVGEKVAERLIGKGLEINVGGGGSRPRRQQMPRGGTLAVGSELPPSHVVVKTWQTFPGGPVFAKLADGHIAVQKKDGTIKHYRPYRPVVIPRKWNARSMGRVATALKRHRKMATKIMQITGGMPKGRK